MSSRSPVKADSIPTQDPSLAPWNISSVSAHRLMELPPASTSAAMLVRWPFPTVDVPDHHHYTLGSVILAVGITGMVGNFLVMYAFCRSRSLRTPANMFIINLALTDFLMCVTQTPIFFINSMHNRWIFGEKACELYAFCGALFGMTSMITLLVIAVDRYFVITRPLASMGVMSRRRALYVMAAAWFYSMFWSLPPFFGWSAYVPEGLMTSCSWDYMTFTPSVRSYTMLLFIFVFFIPLFIIIYCYICIFIAVRSATRAVCKINEGTRDSVKSMHKMRTEWKTAKIALIVILLYVISWAPYSCVALTAFAGYADMLTPYMNSVPAAIAKASAIHNPIIYAITHPKYRLAISRYIPFMGVLLCVPTRDRYSSSSFMSSTRRSTLTSTTSDPGKTGKPRQSSLSDSESAFTDTEAQHSSRPASRQVSSDVTQLHPTFSQRSKGHSSLKLKGRDSGAFEKAASQSPSDPAVCRLHHVTTLTEPEDISMSENVGLTNILPATLDDVREERSTQGVSGRGSSTCLTDLIPAIVLTSTSSPSSISLLQRQGSRGNPANNGSKGAGLAITPDTIAAEGSLIQGDNIVSIDGLSTEGMTHLEAQNKIKMSSNKLTLTMQKSKRPVPIPMAMPRMDSPMPVIPHQKIIANTAGNQEYLPNFNPIALKDSALSTNKPIEVRGPGGKATIVHAQYNTPISMYSQDAIMDAIAGQSQSKGHDGEDVPAGSPLASLPVKDPVVDSASPVYQAVLQQHDRDEEMAEWARRAANLQSKSFRILAHLTNTEYMQDPDEEALQRSRDKFESEVKGLRFRKLKNWHNGLSAQILNVPETPV